MRFIQKLSLFFNGELVGNANPHRNLPHPSFAHRHPPKKHADPRHPLQRLDYNLLRFLHKALPKRAKDAASRQVLRGPVLARAQADIPDFE
jgi:hypothetical protein